MTDEQAVGDARDAEIADLRRQLVEAQSDTVAVADAGAPQREDRAPVPSVDEMARAMKPAALAKADEPPSSAQQKSMRQMEWAGELATSGPPKMPGDVDLGGRVAALETGLSKLAEAVADMPNTIVSQLQDVIRQQGA